MVQMSDQVGLGGWFTCICLIYISLTKSFYTVLSSFPHHALHIKRTSQKSNSEVFRKKKPWWITDDSWEAWDYAGVCRYFSLFLGLNCKLVYVKKKILGGGTPQKKSHLNVFVVFFGHMLTVFINASEEKTKKTFVIGVLLTSFSSSQSFNAPWIEGTFDCVYFYFLEATRISRPPGRRSKLSTQTILKLGSKVAADSSLPPRSILNSRLSSDTLRWRNLLDLTGLKLSLEKLLSSPCFNSAPS